MSCVSSSCVRGVIVSVALFASATIASAVSLDVRHFPRSGLAAAQGALADFQTGSAGAVKRLRTETFDGRQAWNGSSGDSDPVTPVGAFASLGGQGSGATAVNGGTALQVRGDRLWSWGRFSTSGADDNWLDSNDTHGIRWDVGGLPKFNAVGFLLTDVADVGAKFSIKVNDTLFSEIAGAGGKLANGSVHFVRILLPEAVDSLVIELRNHRLNDGFGIDGATVAHVAPVPIPPAAALLLSGMAILGGLRRRGRDPVRAGRPAQLRDRADPLL